MPLVDIQRESLWMIPGYFDGLRSAGAVPVMLPLTSDEGELSELLSMCDGILFTGGQDVDPSVYGACRSASCGECCGERDSMESLILGMVIDRGMPFLGICRGIQSVNAFLGGTLYQDLPSEYGSGVEHHMSPPYDRHVHDVLVREGSPLRNLLGRDRIGVNSYHHQAVKDLAPSLEVMAVSEDGLVEAVFLPGNPFGWAVQWHPELSYRVDDCSAAIFRAFAEAAGEYRSRR